MSNELIFLLLLLVACAVFIVYVICFDKYLSKIEKENRMLRSSNSYYREKLTKIKKSLDVMVGSNVN